MTTVIASIHWGFLPGGIVTYNSVLQKVACKDIRIVQICILGARWAYDKKKLEKLDARIVRLRSRCDFSWIGKMYSLLNSINPDLVMTHGFNGHFVSLLMHLLRRRKSSLVCSYHGVYHATSVRKKFLGFFYDIFTEKFIKLCATSVVCVSNSCEKYLIDKKIDKEKIFVVHNGIDDVVANSKSRNLLRKKWRVTDEEVLLGVISRLDPVKGIADLIDAIEVVFREYSVKLAIIGSGSEDGRLKEMVDMKKMENIIFFTGFMENVSSCYEALDIFVLPSLSEAHSISLIEAMRAQKPIIATAVGGNGESVRDHREALLVSPSCVIDLADSIKKMLGDACLRDRLAVDARKRYLDKFTMEKTLKKTREWILKSAEMRV